MTIKVTKITLEAKAVWFPSKVIRRWPAIIFAIRRTERVIGRITLLTVSIKTMNGMRTKGVLWGKVCANIWLVRLTHP